MNYKFSLGVFINIKFGTLVEVEEEIKMLDSLEGLEHIEIWREADYLEPEADKLLRSLKNKYRLILHAPFINITMASNHELVNQASVETMQKYYDWGVDIGVEVITLHGGHKPFFQSTEVDIENIAKTLAGLKTNDKLQATLEHMPLGKHFSTSINSLMDIEDLEKAVNLLPNWGFTLDIGHVLQNQEDWMKWVENHVERIHDIHLHDAFWGGKAHLPLGTADLKCEDFFLFLADKDYDKFVSLEVVGTEETIQSWQYLRENNLLKK
ncbi:MAG: hypothetical protein COX80_01130 [Candidatus Magasanikbacteria bacterium CG_4_10_14_0_2_um_filter_33_14]|uniref:Xylose isomerase-like TIM barrel domain-containing protein n=1 Tax=Candidatus Magasanikbacteria bacterium CG_4_10_14_0_2_um_filter_33_14 TaxID=1974636 RepID=A0A2M7VBK9_9BACT|nr:MAG: hypothetical protein COX80_01130 [Candidatus Magasanikbacteria bacterium CG_4_10_14_0_2_um_filter_33_14]